MSKKAKKTEQVEKAEATEKVEKSTEEAEQKPTKFAFFIGCTIQVKAPFIEKLAREIYKKIGIELVDLDFTCCPTARVAKEVDAESWLVIAARNLAIAEKAGLPLLVMCTGCTQTLREAQVELEDIDTKKRVNEKLSEIGLEYQGTSEVKFYAQLLFELKDELPIVNKLPINVAAHPGCHILRPSNILNFDDPENPTKLDELIRILGADPVEYQNKALCCGYGLYSADSEAAEQLMKDKMTSFSADCLTVLCPTCFEYYQMRQSSVSSKLGFQAMPVVHYLQLLGIAMGIEDTGMDNLHVKARFKYQF